MNREVPFSAIHCSKISCRADQCMTVELIAADCSTIHRIKCRAQCIAVIEECSAVHYSAVQCIAVIEECSVTTPFLGPQVASFIWHCWTGIMLYCTALHGIALHCTALHCKIIHYTALHCTALHCTALL